jgi:putative flippase GtrA
MYLKDEPRTASAYTSAPPIGEGGLHYTGRAGSRGRHRKPRPLKEIGSEHGKRLLSFSLVGFGVFAAGLGAQVFLVQIIGFSKIEAYVIQLVLSVQANFLANYHWTWGDRGAPFWRSCWRYNIKRLAGIVFNLGVYPVLIHFGMNYVAANAFLVIALTPVNYVLGHFWTFAAASQAKDMTIAEAVHRPRHFQESPKIRSEVIG